MRREAGKKKLVEYTKKKRFMLIENIASQTENVRHMTAAFEVAERAFSCFPNVVAFWSPVSLRPCRRFVRSSTRRSNRYFLQQEGL